MNPTALLRTPVRTLRQHPLYSFAFITTLALAVAAGTATMVVVKRAFLDPMPFLGGERLVSIFTETQTWPAAPVSPHVMTDLAAGAPLTAVTGLEPHGFTYSDGGSTRQVLGIEVTRDFFTSIATPSIGRAWTEGERDVVVVTGRFWEQELESDPRAVGRSIVLGGTPRTVIGVLPGFAAPFWPDADVFTPLDLEGLLAALPRNTPDLTVVAQLADGTTLEQLNAYLDGYTDRVRAEYPELHARQRWWAESLRTQLVGTARPALIGTGLAAGLLLLIVSANIGGLSAALAVGLRHRLAVQGALGATRSRLLRERLTRSALLAALGSGAGIWLAGSLVAAVSAFQPHFLGRMPTVTLDAGTAAAGFAIGIIAGVVSAMIPLAAVVAGRLDPLPSARGTSGGTDLSAFRAGLVVSQVALALVLIVGAGLLVRTVRSLADTNLGYRTEGIYTLSLNLPGPRYETEDAQVAFERQVLDELERLPGVTATSASVGMPIVGGMRAGLFIEGRGEEDGRGEVAYMSIAPGFIPVWEMRLIAGRDFTEADVIDGPGAIVINETVARRYWPNGDALRSRIWIGGAPPEEGAAEWMTVVGVVADVRQHGPTAAVLPTAFGSTRQYSWPRRDFTVKVAEGAPPLTAEALGGAVHRVDPLVPVVRLRRADEMLSEDTARHRLAMFALSFFGAVATILSGFGLYAVVSLTSRLRRREYAIRLAIGAEPENVRRMVIRQGLLLGAGGIVLGVAIAAAGTRALQGLLMGVSPLDATTFATAVALVLMLAAGAAWGPARKAGKTQPVEILNAD